MFDLYFGHLVCGDNNCNAKSGGLWDPEDDCCEQRCSSTRPCAEGSGPCQQDSDCARPWMACSRTCLDRAVFPTAKYPNNSITMGFDGTEKCCHRRCNQANEMICDVDQVGCRVDADCKPGLFCNLEEGLGRCKDHDECEESSFETTVATTCALHLSTTTCINTVGSFECGCASGYDHFQPVIGCVKLLTPSTSTFKSRQSYHGHHTKFCRDGENCGTACISSVSKIPGIQLDYGKTVRIRSVILRTDDHGQTIKNVQFRVSATGQGQGGQGDVMLNNGEVFGTFAGPAGNYQAINTTFWGEFLAGRYLLIQVENNDRFRACEVEAWGLE